MHRIHSRFISTNSQLKNCSKWKFRKFSFFLPYVIIFHISYKIFIFLYIFIIFSTLKHKLLPRTSHQFTFLISISSFFYRTFQNFILFFFENVRPYDLAILKIENRYFSRLFSGNHNFRTLYVAQMMRWNSLRSANDEMEPWVPGP